MCVRTEQKKEQLSNSNTGFVYEYGKKHLKKKTVALEEGFFVYSFFKNHLTYFPNTISGVRENRKRLERTLYNPLNLKLLLHVRATECAGSLVLQRVTLKTYLRLKNMVY